MQHKVIVGLGPWINQDSCIWFGFMEYQPKYGVRYLAATQPVGYLVPNPLYTYILWFDLVGFYGISTIVGYLMPNPLYTYILNIYDLIWLGFMAY